MPPSPAPSQQIRQFFPGFDQSDLVEWLVLHGICKEVKADTVLLQSGGLVRHIPLVFSGSVKVTREDQEGREIFLYYILPGQTCAMTLSACYRGELSRISARTQEDSLLFLIPAAQVYEATRRFPAWQRFAFESFGDRYEELLHALESVVFEHLDERLRKYLLEKSAALQTRHLRISQQQIADDLNASREVVSRLIKHLEQRGLLRHTRGMIEIFPAM